MSGSTDTATQAAAPRNSLRLLLDPTFGPFFFGRLLSTAGIWIHNIVAAILAYELSGSAFVVGLVSVAQFGPQLLLAPLSGAMADRGDRRLQLIAGRLIVGAGSGGLALALWLVGPEGLPGAWPVVLAAGVVGLGFVVGGPAQNALIPSMVRQGELPQAMALNILPPTISRAAGPAVGALIAVSVGPALAFAITMITSCLFALLMVRLRLPTRAEGGSQTDRRVRAGLRYLRQDPGILLLLVGVTAVGIAADPVVTLTPPLSAGFGEGGALVGVFASSFGIGAGAAFLYLTLVRRWLGLPRVATAGLALMAGGVAAAGLSPLAALAIVSFFVAGMGMTLAMTSLSTQLQQRLPEELRGRLMALWAVAFLGSRPIAAAVNGSLADAIGPVVACVVVAVMVGVAAWLCRPSMLAARPAPIHEGQPSAAA